jgi:arylsulfatase A-like enzyme
MCVVPIRFLGWALALTTVAAAGCGGSARPGRVSRDRWNVVLISIDTLRADRLNCYGYRQRPVTPSIDALARDGILFESQIASSPWTTPSHMSLLTSLRPSSHGVTMPFSTLLRNAERGDPIQRLPDARQTLAEALGASGRRTAAFTGGLTLDPRFGFDQGFERYETESRKLRPRNVEPIYDWIDGAGDRPFFLFWHTFEVHAPYLDTTFLDDVVPVETARRLRRGITRSTRGWLKELRSPAEQAELLDRYDAYTLPVCDALYMGGVQSMDRWVGRLVQHLRDHGLYDRTLIAFTSDHGEQLGERGVDPQARGRGIYNLHGTTLYDELLRVPLVLKLPYQEHAGTRVGSVTSAIDVMPTVLDVLGLPAGAQAQGVSLRGRWEGAGEPARLAVSESLSAPDEKKAVRSDRYKYIVSTTSEEVEQYGRTYVPTRLSARELYDLVSDPAEKANLFHGPTAVEAGRTGAPLDEALRLSVSATGASESTTLPEVTRAGLLTLGYVQ